MQNESAHLFNVWEVPRGQAPSLFAEFYAGDILSIRSDVLIVSSFRGDYFPTQGSILGALADRFGLAYGTTLPRGSLSVHPNLHKFPVTGCLAFRDLWVIEIREWDAKSTVTLADVSKAFGVLKGSIAKVAQGDVKSISMPLIGTGSVGLPLQDVVRETMLLVKDWASTAPQLEVVRIFANDLEKVAVLNQAINFVLGFSVQQSASALLAAAAEELRQKVSGFTVAEIAEILSRIAELARSDYPSANGVAIEGRKLAEVCTKTLFQRLNPNTQLPGKLVGLINGVEEYIKKTKESWILNYLRLLQTVGNNAAHASSGNVNLTDAAAVVLAAIRVAEFTQEGQTGPSAAIGRSGFEGL